MTGPDADAPVLFAEPGSSWWPVLWSPAFALAGAAVQAVSGSVHGMAWLLLGVALAGGAAVLVNARRRMLGVRLTTRVLTQGQEQLAVERIVQVDDVGTPVGATVLGGGWTVPRTLSAVPVRLDDGTVVLAWARDGEGLHDALGRLVDR
jgi:membrane protein implicated in regulation of membrane protease activity